MRFVRFEDRQLEGIAIVIDGVAHGFKSDDPRYPGDLVSVIQRGHDALEGAATTLASGPTVDLSSVKLLD